MPERRTAPLLRLRPGLRVSRRGAGELQVGVHHDQRAVLADREPVRRLLRGLDHGLHPERVEPEARPALDTLVDQGLVEPVDARLVRRRIRSATAVAVVAPEEVCRAAVRALSLAGLGARSGAGADAVATLLVTIGAEPRRELVDREMRADRVHLPVTSLAGRTTIGPLVVPGVSACLRCLDEHESDRDPRHALVLEQHLGPGRGDEVAGEDLHLALGWAARDLAQWVDGHEPVTWSATVELREGGPPLTRRWSRHPRCGCAWGDLLVG